MAENGEDKRYLGSSKAVFRIRAGLTFVVYTAINGPHGGVPLPVDARET